MHVLADTEREPSPLPKDDNNEDRGEHAEENRTSTYISHAIHLLPLVPLWTPALTPGHDSRNHLISLSSAGLIETRAESSTRQMRTGTGSEKGEQRCREKQIVTPLYAISQRRHGRRWMLRSRGGYFSIWFLIADGKDSTWTTTRLDFTIRAITITLHDVKAAVWTGLVMDCEWEIEDILVGQERVRKSLGEVYCCLVDTGEMEEKDKEGL
ncbi:uncharacterized protein PAC_02386 [Phialocephala subalpina]|uniref:Uncharacterized protein n=1 Tax=Phialocephala subalpina TaxID=576137 RepID=A0A1L7WIB0_9HELO|nr:uncharacterized protein PAC_02386 [Phialocephala subalpina]